ncbi:Ig-like domain-containing protein [Bacillus mycoides]|uniref:Ig-like domain-containing protein n=1 Tax=Bacillus mycoides TaxID=1405 RepID=UPI0021129AD2|nr:Ig-like domain-containing protein [Bacillus mycoides]MCQ6531147.1 Ig-like domain-containing protein [Bacillus mycoides]
MSITYNVYRNGVKVKGNVSEKSFTDTGLSPNTSYQYQVSAQNEAGESPMSETISVTTKYSAVSGVTLDKSTLTITIGATQALLAKIQPTTAEPGTTWVSSDTTIVTVNANGNITPVKVGTATITVSSKVDATKKATCTVTVVEATAPKPG